jgi:threonine aldolase
VTQPSKAMRAAMAAAEVGDDVYGEDPTVNALEAEVARLLGKEAALFTVTATMANQLALRCQTQPGDAILLEAGAHIRQWESGAPAALSGVTVIPIPSTGGGLIDIEQAWAAADRGSDVHWPPSTLIAVENTANAGGGTVYPLPLLRAVVAGARERGLATHCDGARLWNAAAASGLSEAALVEGYDTVSVCLSKGLGAPVGSLLAGPAALIRRARRFRKMFGGGMRQAGVLAAACRYAIDHNRARLTEDHSRAARLAGALAEQGWAVGNPATNMVFVQVNDPAGLVARAAAEGVRFGASGGAVRLVTHLDVSDDDITRTIAVMAGLRG